MGNTKQSLSVVPNANRPTPVTAVTSLKTSSSPKALPAHYVFLPYEEMPASARAAWRIVSVPVTSAGLLNMKSGQDVGYVELPAEHTDIDGRLTERYGLAGRIIHESVIGLGNRFVQNMGGVVSRSLKQKMLADLPLALSGIKVVWNTQDPKSRVLVSGRVIQVYAVIPDKMNNNSTLEAPGFSIPIVTVAISGTQHIMPISDRVAAASARLGRKVTPYAPPSP